MKEAGKISTKSNVTLNTFEKMQEFTNKITFPHNLSKNELNFRI